VRRARGCSIAVLAAALGAALGAPRSAAGAPDDGAATALPVSGDSTCPSPEAVTQAFSAMGADWHELAARMGGPGPLATITDIGGGFRVAMIGRSRDYFDPRRDCEERARMAAVVVTLMVDALAPPPEAHETRPPPPPPPPPPPAAPARSLTLELAAEGALAAAPSGDRSAGIHAGVTLALGPLALVAAAGASVPHTLALGPVRARIVRFPALLGARLGGRVLGADLGVELGAAGTLTQIENENPATPVRQTRPALGIHGALVARFAARRRLSPIAGVSADLFPVSYAFTADPLGDVGHSARVWIGAWLGAAFDVR
jgi:hypothetical protein